MANLSEAKHFTVSKESSKFLGPKLIRNSVCSRLNPLCVSLHTCCFLYSLHGGAMKSSVNLAVLAVVILLCLLCLG